MISESGRREMVVELLGEIRMMLERGEHMATVAGSIMGLAIYVARTSGLTMAVFATSLDELWHSKQWDETEARYESRTN